MANIVILGATGHFGKRIAHRIAGNPEIGLTVTSRNLRAVEELAAALTQKSLGAKVCAAALDQDSVDFSSELASLNPDFVIHTAGPYQGQDYRVARACIQCRSHYVDMADGRDFVRGFHALNDEAAANDVLLVSGASTLPGLSSVVVTELQDRFANLRSVETSIAPAHQTPRGIGTIAAVLSYCGAPFDALVDNAWHRQYGWQGIKSIHYPDLGRRLAAVCDVPDLDLFPQRFERLETVTFHAALEAKWEQLALWTMAALTRLRLVRDWSKFVSTFRWMSEKSISFGSDKGGMLISLTGEDAKGRRKNVRWILTAGQNHGPEIPCTPALILAQKLASKSLNRRGAMPCWNLFSLDDFDHAVSDFDIQWRVEELTSDRPH